MYRTIQLVLGSFVILLIAISTLARRFPDVAWLQLFRLNTPQLSNEQRAKLRQRSNIDAGVELILIGVVVPFAYFAITMMTFNEPTILGAALAIGSSIVLVTLGTVAIWTNRRRASNRD